jgi:hypothetical protein
MVIARRLLVSILIILAACSNALAAKRELTPADALATVRIVQNQIGTGVPVENFASPDGKRYLIRLVYGDVKRNGVWMDLLTGPLSSLDAAAHPRRCAHLFTTGLGSLTSARSAEADPDAINVIRWTDANHISFLWSDERATRQIMSLNLDTCKHQFVTHMMGDVFSFLSTPDGTSLVDAQVPSPRGVSEKLWAQGFTIGDSTDGLSILLGHVEDGNAVDDMFKNTWFIHSAGTTRSLKIGGERFDPTNPYSRDLTAGPSGRYALVSVGRIGPRPLGWDKYDNPGLQSYLANNDGKTRLPVRYAVIDLHAAVSHMLWNAPKSGRGQANWSPTEDAVLLSPTFLPVDSNNIIGLAGNAAATVDAATGNYQVLPVDLTNRTVNKARWESSTEISISSTDALGANPRTQRFTRIDSTWHEAPDLGDAHIPNETGAPFFLEARQTLNTPPQIFAVDARTGSSRLFLDPNPRLLTDFKLGRQERLSGTLPNGKPWIAQLIYPADFQPGIRYPLVIQCMYGSAAFGPEEFSLIGTWAVSGFGLGPTPFASYPGQSLATRNIAVLVLKVMSSKGGIEESDDRQLGFETLARQLIDSGLADENKIALDGFSRNGYFVEYTLAHSSFPFTAAIAGDNYEPSYFQSALANWRDWDVATNGAPAFGAGLQTWLAHAPGFNAEHMHVPLMMIGQSGGIVQIIGEWEVYSRLHHLHKPVEMYMMPQADRHPAHNTQNPRQIIAIQQKAIDWLDFWLTGREDSGPDKREQYARWRAFRTAQTTADLQSARSP